jgi:hypothetical protein
VYRLQVADIPNANGLELYPTIEMIDRTYPPPCLALRYPVPIELTQEELELAARGAFVTRIIYVEDPSQALPITRKVTEEQPWFEAPAGEDPLVTADRLGRPIAILRIGGRVPNTATDANGCQIVPKFVSFEPPAECEEGDTVIVPDGTIEPAQPLQPAVPTTNNVRRQQVTPAGYQEAATPQRPTPRRTPQQQTIPRRKAAQRAVPPQIVR